MDKKEINGISEIKLFDLKALQQHFSQSLLYQTSDISLQLKTKPGFSADQLVQIHRNNFIISVTESLKGTFKYTEQLVGDEFFDAVARQFILQQPPSTNNIIIYGALFSGYLASLPQLNEMPYIAEMARFEWLYEQCQNLPLQMTTFDVQSLQQVDPNDFGLLRFSIVPHCCTFTSQQNIHLLLKMIVNNEVKEVDLTKPCYLLLQKHPNFHIGITELSTEQWQLIQQLQKETTLEALDPSSLQEQLSHLLTMNLISDVTIDNKD